MSSIIKVNTFQDANGNALFSSDGSGNVTTNNLLKPAFEAYQNPAQTPGNNVWTKLTITNETFDTDSAYDTTNSKFTVPSGQAGTYFFTLEAGGYDTSTTLNIVRLAIYKNGSAVKINTALDTDATSIQTYFASMTAILELSVGDYIEAYINPAYSGTFTTLANASGQQTRFLGFKLIGA